MSGINFEEDAQSTTAPSNEQLHTVAYLVEQATLARSEVERLEQALKEAKEHERKLLEDDLPTAMLECGVASYELADGHGVKIKDIIQASPKVADREWCYDWLREHGLGDLIKNEVTAKFGAGDEEQAEAVLLYLEECHFDATRKATVHPQTLSAQIRKWYNGTEQMPVPLEEFPADKFGVYQGRRAEID